MPAQQRWWMFDAGVRFMAAMAVAAASFLALIAWTGGYLDGKLIGALAAIAVVACVLLGLRRRAIVSGTSYHEPRVRWPDVPPGQPEDHDGLDDDLAEATPLFDRTLGMLVLDTEPSDIALRYYYPTEKHRMESRRHWIRLVKELMVGAAIALLIQHGLGVHIDALRLSITIPPGPMLAAPIVWVIWLAWRATDWFRFRITLTNVRLSVIRGVVIRRVATAPLSRMSDISYVRSPLGVLLGYGSFRFLRAGWFHPLRRIGDLPNPTELYLQILEERYVPAASESRRRPRAWDDEPDDSQLSAFYYEPEMASTSPTPEDPDSPLPRAWGDDAADATDGRT